MKFNVDDEIEFWEGEVKTAIVSKYDQWTENYMCWVKGVSEPVYLNECEMSKKDRK